MNLADVTKILCNAFTEGYSTGSGTVPPWTSTPIAMENEIFDREPFWVRMYVRELGGHQQTLGVAPRRRWQRDCAAYVQVFAPVEGAFPDHAGGVQDLGDLAEDARRFFEGKTIAPAKFHAARVDPLPADDKAKGRWIGRLVTCFFYFHEIA